MTDRIERELVVDAPVQDVWDLVTSPGWLGDEVELQLVAGGDARFRCGGELKLGWVEQAVPPSRLAFWWALDGDVATRVELTLTPSGGGGTRLRVVEERPLDVLDLVGIPLRTQGGATYGPALLAAA
jgi:uncharacterized protein YndB with AHSA1/START domain